MQHRIPKNMDTVYHHSWIAWQPNEAPPLLAALLQSCSPESWRSAKERAACPETTTVTSLTPSFWSKLHWRSLWYEALPLVDIFHLVEKNSLFWFPSTHPEYSCSRSLLDISLLPQVNLRLYTPTYTFSHLPNTNFLTARTPSKKRKKNPQKCYSLLWSLIKVSFNKNIDFVDFFQNRRHLQKNPNFGLKSLKFIVKKTKVKRIKIRVLFSSEDLRSLIDLRNGIGFLFRIVVLKARVWWWRWRTKEPSWGETLDPDSKKSN